jgi:hypothetical protein
MHIALTRLSFTTELSSGDFNMMIYSKLRKIYDGIVGGSNYSQNSCLLSNSFLYCGPDFNYVRFEVFTSVTMKNAVFWDIKSQFIPHRKHITSPLQSPAG